MAKLEFTKLDKISERPVTYRESLITVESNFIESYYGLVYENNTPDDDVTVLVTTGTAASLTGPYLVKGSYSEIKAFIENTPQP
jgi:hypothetical protein